ncbi:MAG: prolyl oligopeptidase family serine peptidase [Bryobacteraceae bacterium]
MLLRTFALALTALAANAAPEARFLNRTVTVDGTEYRYVVSVPGDWTATRTWPIILFLHGSVERGDDGMAQSKVGLANAVWNHTDRFPAIVVMPQCRPDVSWEAPAMEAQTMAALDASAKEFNGDPQRTYLTGFSMGGYGTWLIAARHPVRFAALVVVCGGIQWPTPDKITREEPYMAIASKVAGIPVWVFHGNADRNVFVTESREMVKLLRGLNADVRYTEYEGVGHESWDRAYNEPELPTWLFSHRLGNGGNRGR